ncbi:MAG TPA: hypothetical protein VJR30_03425 [Bradyrhizobium sp.]|nr:hypothetical protein [Bradyrhizobium sp.]
MAAQAGAGDDVAMEIRPLSILQLFGKSVVVPTSAQIEFLTDIISIIE